MVTGGDKKPQDEAKGFSFQELEAEADVPAVVPGASKPVESPPQAEPTQPSQAGTGFVDLASDVPEEEHSKAPQTAEDFDALEAKEEEDRINARVLTQSTQSSAPLWLTSLVAAGLTVVLLVMLIRSAGENGYSTILTYATMGVSVGGMLWAASGAMNADSPKERNICITAILTCLVSGGIALFIKLTA